MTRMAAEIRQSAAAVAGCLAQPGAFAAIAQAVRQRDPPVLLVCARGSSGHAGTFLRYLLARELGLVAAAAMPSIASLYGRRQRVGGAFFVAISQSGRSPDLIRQTEDARAGGALTLAIVNDATSPLAVACEHVLDIQAGPEHSVAATKTVLGSLAAALGLTQALTGSAALAAALGRLPGRLTAAAGLDWSPLTAELARVDRMFTVGRGPGLAIAAEAALKLAETTGVAALACSSAELSHGPRALAGPDFPLLAFVQDDAARPGTQAVLADLAALGAPVFAAGLAGPGLRTLPTLPPDHADTDLLPQLLAFYLATEAAARARGRDPDHPPGLSKVTQTL
jgi:glucosamine--fructose-6-phosphate aminotransferase (isomerizing)